MHLDVRVFTRRIVAAVGRTDAHVVAAVGVDAAADGGSGRGAKLERRRAAWGARRHRLVAAVDAAVVHVSRDRVCHGLRVPAGPDTVGAAGQVF